LLLEQVRTPALSVALVSAASVLPPAAYCQRVAYERHVAANPPPTGRSTPQCVAPKAD